MVRLSTRKKDERDARLKRLHRPSSPAYILWEKEEKKRERETPSWDPRVVESTVGGSGE